MGKGKSKKTKIVTGLDISSLSKVRPTKIPQAKTAAALADDEPIAFKKIAIHLGIILGIILIAYGYSAFGQFVFQDSFIQDVLKNKIAAENFWLDLFLKAMVSPLTQSWLLASFALDFQSYATQPAWYHIINIILHAAACFYFYCLVLVIARKRSKVETLNNLTYEVPLLAAALLACHPLAAESVSHITGRQGTLTACNVFLSLLFFIYGFWAESSAKMFFGYIASLIFFSMGIWSGSEAMAIPALAIATIFLLCPDSLTVSDWLKQTWPEVTAMILLMMATCVLPFLGVGTDLSNYAGAPALSPTLYYASQLKALVVYYLRAFVLPVGLSVVPPFVVSHSWLDPYVLIGVGFLILTIWAIYRLRKQALPAFGLTVFLLASLPNILIVQPEVAADRRFYVPLAGLCLFSAWYIVRDLAGRRLARFVVPSVLCLILIGLTIWRNFAWQSNLSLWQATVKTNPADAIVRAMLARTYLDAGKSEEARKEAEIALQIDSNNVIAYLTLGRIEMDAKDYTEAKDSYQKALKIATDEHSGQLVREAQLGLGNAQVNLGEFGKAKELALRLLVGDRNNVQANLIMGKSLIGLKQPMAALNFLNTGLKEGRMNPEYLEPIAEAGLASGVDNLVRSAYGASRMALRVAPTENAEKIFAQSALQTRHFDESKATIDSLLKKQPENPQYLYLKSCVEKELGNSSVAEKYKNMALQRDPDVAKKLSIRILPESSKFAPPLRQPGTFAPPVQQPGKFMPPLQQSGKSASPLQNR
jgi:tetratricopeptide (TPR) repeat protein